MARGRVELKNKIILFIIARDNAHDNLGQLLLNIITKQFMKKIPNPNLIFVLHFAINNKTINNRNFNAYECSFEVLLSICGPTKLIIL